MMNPLTRDYKKGKWEVGEGVGKSGKKRERMGVKHECGKERFFGEVRCSIWVPDSGLGSLAHVSVGLEPREFKAQQPFASTKNPQYHLLDLPLWDKQPRI